MKAGNLTFQRHKNMKTDIHRLMDDYRSQGIYSRTLQDVGVPEKAFVYHPVVEDSSSYIAINTVPAPKNTGVLPTTCPVLSDDLVPTIAIKADARGTFCLAAKTVKDFGLEHGDYVHVSVDKKTLNIKLSDSNYDSLDVIAKYKVDEYNNVRITSAVLKEIGGGNANNFYETTIHNDYILVKLDH
jgi:hypothetical protein